MKSEPSNEERAALGRALARRVSERAPVGIAEARRLIATVLGVFGAMLTAEERRPLARALPPAWARAFAAPAYHSSMNLARLYRECTRDRDPGTAREQVQVVLAALAELGPPPACARMRRALPAEVGALLEPRRVEDVEGVVPSTAPRRASTLASGRPGSARPLAEAAPAGAQRDSVATPNPHADRKLSSARGPGGGPRTIANATVQKRG